MPGCHGRGGGTRMPADRSCLRILAASSEGAVAVRIVPLGAGNSGKAT